ncbi:MAG TPA: hypothetical protein VH309_13900 [Elusimicrobiota bacterium]|jgi:hypothetical protein|nr:hypothetical protein [Elusimicrobiota bacterium]
MGFDYFVGELRCPACGKVTAADGQPNIQTKIRDEAELAYLGIGARVDTSARNMERSDYLELRAPGGGELRVLQTWECPYCSTPFNWAEIVIRDGEIRGVSAVPMTPKTLATAHYMHEFDAGILAAQTTGRPSDDFARRELLDIIRGLAG